MDLEILNYVIKYFHLKSADPAEQNTCIPTLNRIRKGNYLAAEVETISTYKANGN